MIARLLVIGHGDADDCAIDDAADDENSDDDPMRETGW